MICDKEMKRYDDAVVACDERKARFVFYADGCCKMLSGR